MFYLSSRGSTANIWLGKILSSHPDVVCIRATRSFPFVGPGSEDNECHQLPPDLFIRGLVEAEKATYNQKIFGSAHGYYGVAAKLACEESGGVFSYITRSPLERIHSCYEHNLRNCHFEIFSTTNDDPFVTTPDSHGFLEKNHGSNEVEKFVQSRSLKKLCVVDHDRLLKKFKDIKKYYRSYIIGNGLKQKETPFYKHIPENKKPILTQVSSKIKKSLSNARSKFTSVPEIGSIDWCGEMLLSNIFYFFLFEDELLSNCSKEQGFSMELLTSSKDYFHDFITRVVRVEDNSKLEEFLKKSWPGPRFNTHRISRLNDSEIYFQLPDLFKIIYNEFFDLFRIGRLNNIFNYNFDYLDRSLEF